jgi:hypothetical protein
MIAMFCLCAAYLRPQWVRDSNVIWFASHIAAWLLVAPLILHGTAFMRSLWVGTAAFAVRLFQRSGFTWRSPRSTFSR